MLSPCCLLVQTSCRGEASGLSRRENHLFNGQILRFAQNDNGLYSLTNKIVTITNDVESASLSNDV
jgi:hypothetical protein